MGINREKNGNLEKWKKHPWVFTLGTRVSNFSSVDKIFRFLRGTKDRGHIYIHSEILAQLKLRIFFTKLLHLKKIIKQDITTMFFWLPLMFHFSPRLLGNDSKCCSHFDHVIKRCDLVGGLFEITCGSEAYQHYAREN